MNYMQRAFDGAEPEPIVESDLLERAALSACRNVWRLHLPGTFDEDCPDQARWIEEELEALIPAVKVILKPLVELTERLEQGEEFLDLGADLRNYLIELGMG